ncbi:MAG: hypothetical protein WB992_11460 [Bryobacteraceae bacterium]
MPKYMLAATVLLTGLASGRGREAQQQSASSEPLVIQGGITGIQGEVVTMKTPNAYPGGAGGHPQYVVAGPTFKVDISRARVLLADGKQVDTRPLAVGDRVLMVLSGAESQPPAPVSPRNVNQTYFASIIERIAQSEKIVTH